MNAGTFPAPSVSSALTVQGRVITALILREVHTLYGNTRLGYLWAIIQTAFNIGVFWLFREFLGAHAPHSMEMAVFLLCGFIPWYMFSDTVSRCMKAVSANQALLAARAGAAYVSPFLGRLDDIGQPGIDLIETIHDMFLNYPDIETQIIAASVRNPIHVTDCALAGADIATVPYKVIEQMLHHPLTDSGIERFNKDWAEAFGDKK